MMTQCTLNDLEKAYLAGIIDGEGTVALAHAANRYTLRPLVNVSNCDMRLMAWLKARIQFGNVVSRGKPRKSNWKKGYIFMIEYAWKCKVVLELILPYLILKRRQAELLLEYCSSHEKGKYTERDLVIFLELKALNKRGP